jgi:D-glycero-D-manno-heptose 1,7-bisphosphate phosphatase
VTGRPDLVLLDRDGTINVKAAEGEYVTSVYELELLQGVAAAVRRLNERGIPVAVVTNQRGIALGRMTEDDLEAVHAALAARLGAEGARFDTVYHCPHDRGVCACRKPEPGLLLRAARDFGAAPGRSVMIGDADSDVEAGQRAGMMTVQLSSAAAASPQADRVVPTLSAAVDLLLAL